MRSKFEVMRENRRKRERKPSHMYWLGGCVGGTGGPEPVKTLAGLYGNAYANGELVEFGSDWYARQALPEMLDQQRDLGMRQRMLNPSAGAEQADLDELSNGPDVHAVREEPRNACVRRNHADELSMRFSKLAQKLAKLFRR